MNTQPEQDRNEAQEVKQGDLKASDFFPPGVGWNQVGGEEEEVRDLERETPRERLSDSH